MAKKPAPKKKNSAKPVAKKAVKKVVSKKAVKSPPVKAKAPISKIVKTNTKGAETSKVPVKKNGKAKSEIEPVKTKMATKEVEPEESVIVTPAKTQSVVSMIESDSQSSDETGKAEKVSKVKPVKIERGNLADEKAKWAELYKKYGKDKAVTYKMSDKFMTMVGLQHKVLGWGFILTNENDRLEVLFETGIRMLISNYKS